MAGVSVTGPGPPPFMFPVGQGAIPPWHESGRVPLVLRIGVTGHRHLADPAAVAGAVRAALQLIRDQITVRSSTDVVLVAVSALAEGADRLLAREVLAEPHARLEAVLPGDRAGYAQDFQTTASRREFDDLLKQASRVWQAPALASRQEGYEWAGRRVTDRSDILVAVWDGQPSRGRGGTQEIVAYAREKHVPLVWIRVNGEGETVPNPQLDTDALSVLREIARDLSKYNAGRIPCAAFRSQVTSQLGRLGVGAATGKPAPPPLRQDCEQVAAWLVPFFVRADVQAFRLHRRFRALSIAMFAMAALAVAIVAIQVNFWPGANWVAGFEVLLLLLLLGIPLIGSRLRLHERWTSYRFLAERLRSAYFLALAGATDRQYRQDTATTFTDPDVIWIERALAEITASQPRPRPPGADIAPLRSYLADHWIDDQAVYHIIAAGRHERLEDRLRRATAALFTITLIAAILHLLGIGHHGSHKSALAGTLIVLSICIPAVGSAVHGIETQGQHRRHAQRFGRMVTLLGQLHKRMNDAQDLAQVQATAVEVERVMREESHDWFGVMRFHDVELIT